MSIYNNPIILQYVSPEIIQQQVVDTPIHHLFKNANIFLSFVKQNQNKKIKAKLISDSISELENKLKISQDKLFLLQGGKFSKIFLIGFIVKLIFKYIINRKLVGVEIQYIADLKKQVAMQKDEHHRLNEILKTQEDVLNLCCSGLSVLGTTSKNMIPQEADLPAIFGIEDLLRQVEEIKQIEDLKINAFRFLLQAKQFLLSRPFHLAVVAAAERGKVVSLAQQTIKLIKEKEPFSILKASAGNKLLWNRKNKILCKFTRYSHEEDQIIIRDLFPFIGERVVIDFFILNPSFIPRHQIPLFDSEEIEKGVSLIKRRLRDNIYLIPHLSPTMKEAYKRCAQYTWVYGVNKIKNPVNQFIFDLNTVSGKHMRPISIMMNDEESPLTDTIKQDLDLLYPIPDWLLALNIESPNSKLPLMAVRPFMDHFFTLKWLSQFPGVEDGIFDRMTPESEFISIVLAELQPLDMHEDNVAFVPEMNEEYEKFRFKTFSCSIDSSSWDFLKILINDILNRIPDDTVISYVDDDQKEVKGTYKELVELRKACKVRWKWALIDLDHFFAEDNEFVSCYLYDDGVKRDKMNHLIPFRSDLLNTKWRDRPLSPETLDRLLDCKNRDKQIIEWLEYRDAPLWKRLSKEVAKQVKGHLKPILKQFSLTRFRKENKNFVNIQFVRHNFVNTLCLDINSPIWELLEQELNDNLRLPQNESKRRKIAYQLFPRVTPGQLSALKERMDNRISYLEYYKDLCSIVKENEDLREQLDTFVNDNNQLFPQLIFEWLISQIKGGNTDVLQALRTLILHQYRPTYFNLAKMMYPQLADFVELVRFTYPNWEELRIVGNYKYPLETIIEKAMTFPEGHGANVYGKIFQDKLDENPNSSFSGHWQA